MKRTFIRMLSMFLVMALLIGDAVPTQAVHDHTSGTQELDFYEVESNSASDKENVVQDEMEEFLYADTDLVRVSIILERESTIQAGFSTNAISENAEAMAYREDLKNEQISVMSRVEAAVGETLDVSGI